MADESRLSITIDSRGAEKNADNLSDALDRVEESGNEASASTSRLSEVTLKLGSNMSKAAAATVASLSRIESATVSTSAQLTALVSRSVALESAMTAVGQGVGRLDSGITQSNAQLGQLNTQMAHLVTTFGSFSQGQSAINAQLTRIAANMSQAADEAQNLDQATSRVGRSSRSTEQSIDEERAGLVKLLGQINPTVAALDRLDAMQEKLARYKKLGLVDAETVAEANARLKAMRDALSDTSDGLNKTGLSAKQMANNLRMLPAQITDITVGLASGQAPFTVLLQQGGQLKDMFGGIGPAAKAVGGYVAGLVNPFTLAAAAVGALGVAYYQGSEETERLTTAIIANGNAIGSSADQLANFARQVGAGDATIAAASDAIAQLAEGGNRLTGLYPKIASAALSWSKQTGQSVQDVIGNFNDLAKNPAQAVKKLDDQFNFLTASQYANIQTLLEQKRTTEAATVATETFADVMDRRAGNIKENLGDVERAWQAITREAAKAWNAMLDVGRAKTLEQQLDDVETKLANAQKGISTSGRAKNQLGLPVDSVSTLEAERDRLKIAIQERNLGVETERLRAEGEARSKKFIDATNSAYNSTLPQVKKLQDLLDDLKKQHDENAKNGAVDAVTETKYATARKNIEQQIADIKEREAKKNAPKGQNKGVAEAENTFARLYGQYDPAAQAARALTKEQTQLDLALSKGKITQEEYGKALAQASMNYSAAIKGAQGLTQAEQYRAQLQKQLDSEKSQYSLEAAGVGMGDLQFERMQKRIQLEQQTNDRIKQLRTELANATTAKQREELQKEIDQENEFLPKRLAALQNGFAQYDEAIRNPINGWTAAIQNFGDQAANIAGQVQSTFESAFNTITGDITSSIMEGGLSMKTLGSIGQSVAKDVIEGFVKIGVQMLANAALSSTLQAAEVAKAATTGGAIATAMTPAAGMASIASFGGAAAAGLAAMTAALPKMFSLIGFADGGFVSGPGTSRSDSIPAMLSNGEFVVNAAATRRNRALLEAINSNDRTITSSGSSAGSAPVGGYNVDIYNYGPTPVETNMGDDGRLKVIIRAVEDHLTNSIYSGTGKMNGAVESAYGLKRRGG
ncbi:phage tail length tape measure family protein [Pseudomonas sp. 273]|uniref:phage tail length tape measure family protein n=1 Tax=Pseudomonas sp. 273 TaxID=75692 RepID=UPI0023D8B05F|nr:phage tail length tape measure family protein [Pseudomonas sp. 273]